MKKIGLFFIAGIIICIIFTGCTKTSNDQNTKPASQEKTTQKETAKKEQTQAELNAQLKKDATQADFVQLNGHEEEYKDKKVFVEGTVSSITQEGSVGGKFTVTVQEGNGYGMYGITSLDTENNYNVGKDIVKNNKVKIYGTVNGKDSFGAPHIVATIVEKE